MGINKLHYNSNAAAHRNLLQYSMYVCMYVCVCSIYIYIYIVIGIRILCCSVFDFKLNGLKYLVKKKKQKKMHTNMLYIYE